MLPFCQRVAKVSKSVSEELNLINTHNFILPYILIPELCFQPVKEFHFRYLYIINSSFARIIMTNKVTCSYV